MQNRETAIENVAKRVCGVSPHVPSWRAIQQECSSPVPNPTLIRKTLGEMGHTLRASAEAETAHILVNHWQQILHTLQR